MRKNPSSFFPFEKPLYKDWVFYFFVYYCYRGMNENLRDFIQYGDSNRLPALLIDFVGSIFTAWVMSIALFAIKDWVQEKLRKKSESKPTSDYHLTKLSKPLSDMNESERRQAAEDISETIQKQIDDYKGKKSDD